jgi:ubiquitin-conjugating enzyme E2 W
MNMYDSIYKFIYFPFKPIDSPEVIFVGNIPIHEHIYSNGYICLSILYDGNKK